MHYLYYCNSSYQLINVLNLHWQRQFFGFENIDNYSADLIMLNAYEGAEDISKILIDNKIFDNVKVIDRIKNESIFHLFITIKNIIFPKHFIAYNYKLDANSLINKYDYICTPKFNKIIASIWQLNPKAKLQMHEDGLSSYIDDFGNKLFSKSYKLFYKVFNYYRDFNDLDALYLNDSNLYVLKDKRKEVLKNLPKINDESINKLLEIFINFSNNTNKKLFWFSQYFNDSNNMDSMNNLLIPLIRYSDLVLFCPHPRNPIGNNIFDESNSKKIWEINYLLMDDIENKCFVSAYSTACVSPKLLYEKEPYVILCYKMIQFFDSNYLEKLDLLIEKIKDSYSDKNKFMVPQNIEEFIQCVNYYVRTVNKQTK